MSHVYFRRSPSPIYKWRTFRNQHFRCQQDYVFLFISFEIRAEKQSKAHCSKQYRDVRFSMFSYRNIRHIPQQIQVSKALFGKCLSEQARPVSLAHQWIQRRVKLHNRGEAENGIGSHQSAHQQHDRKTQTTNSEAMLRPFLLPHSVQQTHSRIRKDWCATYYRKAPPLLHPTPYPTQHITPQYSPHPTQHDNTFLFDVDVYTYTSTRSVSENSDSIQRISFPGTHCAGFHRE